MEAGAAASAPRTSGAPSAWDYRLAVLRHYRAVYGYAASILGSSADAEDVTQEAFLRFGQKGGRVRKVREWLLSVTRNLCIDRFRSGSRTTAIDGEILEVLSSGDDGADDDPAGHAERGEIGDRLTALIGRLPEPQRSLVVLFDVQGFSGDECGRILGLSVNQVKVYLHRARRRLRQGMEAYE